MAPAFRSLASNSADSRSCATTGNDTTTAKTTTAVPIHMIPAICLVMFLAPCAPARHWPQSRGVSQESGSSPTPGRLRSYRRTVIVPSRPPIGPVVPRHPPYPAAQLIPARYDTSSNRFKTRFRQLGPSSSFRQQSRAVAKIPIPLHTKARQVNRRHGSPTHPAVQIPVGALEAPAILAPRIRRVLQHRVHRRRSSCSRAHESPWSAARRYHRTASTRSRCTPRPVSYMKPRLACPRASPWSAERRNQRTACVSF